MPRYLIIPQRERLASDFVMGVLYVVMFILATLFFAGFFYLGAKPLDSEVFEMRKTPLVITY